MANIIRIDRSNRADLEFMLKDGWKISEQDRRSLSLAELDLDKIQLHLVDGARLQDPRPVEYIRLDLDIMLHLFKNQDLIPAKLKEEMDGKVNLLFFEGEEFVASHDGHRAVLGIRWDKRDDGEYKWRWVLWHLRDVLEGDNFISMVIPA